MPESKPPPSNQPPPVKSVQPVADGQWEFAHGLLFTGHMIDSSDREKPRFPAWAETRARAAIREALASVIWTHPGSTIGMAGGASGGDLLFHECCEELGIPSRIMLALPPKEFIACSVAPAGPEWVQRFHTLLRNARPDRLYIMAKEDGLLEGPTDNIWQRANLWMIEEATAVASEQALLALWDGSAGDGPGGTEHFLQVARNTGIRILPPIQMPELLKSQER